MIAGALEIHQVNVSQGDCTLVLSRDLVEVRKILRDEGHDDVAGGSALDLVPFCTTNGISLDGTVLAAVLIDAGNIQYGADVRNYLHKLGAIRDGLWQEQLSLVITHYHDDHQDGLRSLMRDALPESELREAQRLNRQNADQVPTTREVVRPARLYRPEPYAPHDTSLGMFPAIEAEIGLQTPVIVEEDARTTSVIPVPRGGRMEDGNRFVIPLETAPRDRASDPGQMQIGDDPEPVDDPDTIEISVLASDQALFLPGGLLQAIPNKHPNRQTRPLSVNDRSMVLMVSYGWFRHFLGGDIGGPNCTIEADVETRLAEALPAIVPATIVPAAPAGHCCSAKLSHHGSRFSNENPVLAGLRPTLAVVSTGFRQYFHGHPTQEAVDRTFGGERPVTHLFATEIAQRAKGKDFNLELPAAVRIVGDIVVRPLAPPDGAPRLIQVYGTGEQSEVDDDGAIPPRYELRDKEPPNPLYPNYPIGPFLVACERH